MNMRYHSNAKKIVLSFSDRDFTGTCYNFFVFIIKI